MQAFELNNSEQSCCDEMKTRINSEPEKLASFPFVARRSSGKSSHSQSKKRRKVMSDSIDPARILNTGFGWLQRSGFSIYSHAW